MEKTFTPSDRTNRTIGIILLVLSIIVALLPRIESNWLIASSWFIAAILLLTSPYAGGPMPRLVRWGAAILLVVGLAAPFIANFINQALGAN
jgi:hypothetical protein